MPAVGEYADTLRAVGRFLTQVDASEIVISEHDEHLDLTWLGRGKVRESRRLRPIDVDALRISARLYRGLEGSTVRFTVAELLRTLGVIIDETRAVDVRLLETADGFELSARSGDRPITSAFACDELVEHAAEYHRRRSTP